MFLRLMIFFIAGFVANDGKSFETVLKFDEESLSNEERYEILQQKELIDELLDGGTQSNADDMDMMKERVEKCIHHVY